MIDVGYFEENQRAAGHLLASASAQLTFATGRPSRLRLARRLDGRLRERVLELNEAAFGREGEVFDRRTLDELEADPDALFVVIEIGGTVEGFVFGYYEAPGEELVEGTDFFLDTGMVSDRWRGKGVGTIAARSITQLLMLLGDVTRVGTAAWEGGETARLLTLYHRMGFVDAPSSRFSGPCLALDLASDRVPRVAIGSGPASDGA